jgi:hypothetical protein
LTWQAEGIAGIIGSSLNRRKSDFIIFRAFFNQFTKASRIKNVQKCSKIKIKSMEHFQAPVAAGLEKHHNFSTGANVPSHA